MPSCRRLAGHPFPAAADSARADRVRVLTIDLSARRRSEMWVTGLCGFSLR
jgi:hypothetical protein